MKNILVSKHYSYEMRKIIYSRGWFNLATCQLDLTLFVNALTTWLHNRNGTLRTSACMCGKIRDECRAHFPSFSKIDNRLAWAVKLESEEKLWKPYGLSCCLEWNIPFGSNFQACLHKTRVLSLISLIIQHEILFVEGSVAFLWKQIYLSAVNNSYESRLCTWIISANLQEILLFEKMTEIICKHLRLDRGCFHMILTHTDWSSGSSPANHDCSSHNVINSPVVLEK